MRGLIAAVLAPACIGSVTPAQCAVDSECGAASVCVGAVCHPGSRELDGGVCPLVQPRWSEINSSFIQIGCGVRESSTNCHSIAGAATSSRLRAFEFGALDAAGLAPELSACARCGADVL